SKRDWSSDVCSSDLPWRRLRSSLHHLPDLNSWRGGKLKSWRTTCGTPSQECVTLQLFNAPTLQLLLFLLCRFDLHDVAARVGSAGRADAVGDRKSTRLNSSHV